MMKNIPCFNFFLIYLSMARASVERSIVIMNQSGRRVDVHWVPPHGGEMILQSKPDLLNGASLNLNSFVGHKFQVRELPGKQTGACIGEDQQCRIDHFTVNSHENQVIFIHDGIEVEHSDTKTIAEKSATKLLDQCRSNAKQKVRSNPNDANSILGELSSCVQDGIAREIERANEEIKFQADIRGYMADLLEDYTCDDGTLNTTEAKSSTSWMGRKVDVMLNRPVAKIHFIENFISDDECNAVQEDVKDRLEDATVADGEGGSELDDGRKAKQAAVEVEWEEESKGDLIAKLSRRVYDYTNHVLPFKIDEDGQEDIMSIQYFGRGAEDEQPDRYRPHCDGDCDGMSFKEGDRVATMVMYCDIPTVGGATNFMKAGVHIKPKKHAAVFFSYINPDTMIRDDGLTQHSGCPVIEGEKRIVTQWIRLGVDEENPWDSFNTLGVKYSDAENQ